MSHLHVQLQPGFLLQHKPYRETSLLIDVLTRDFGRVALIAKGVKKPKSKFSAFLRPFLPLVISYTGKTDLKTLTHVETFPEQIKLNGKALYCGFYINELVSHFLHKYDPHPEVFDIYQKCLLDMMEVSEIEQALRIFELKLLNLIGYGLRFDFDINQQQKVSSDKNYLIQADIGPIEAVDGEISGATLLALQAMDFRDAKSLEQAKKVMRQIIDYHLQGKPLKSRAVITNILRQDRK